MKYRLTNWLTVFLSAQLLISCAGKPKNEEVSVLPPVSELPKPEIDAVELDHGYFHVKYSKKHRVPIVVSYTVTKADLKGPGKRRDNFHKDKLLVAKGIDPVGPDDYPGHHYDRGHMAPAADFVRSQAAIDETFVMTNMAPQTRNLNRRAWNALEARVRTWICGEEKLTIYTGPILRDDLPKIEKGISVPDSFFKVVFDETPPKKSIAFVYSQSDKGNPILKRKTTIDEVENETGLKIQKEESKYPDCI